MRVIRGAAAAAFAALMMWVIVHFQLGGQATVTGAQPAAGQVAVGKGPGFEANRAAVINGEGTLNGATGTLSNCVHVDGSSAACGSGGGATIPSVTNLIKGTGSGNGADSGIAPNAAGIVGLFSGCSGVLALSADGGCHAGSGVSMAAQLGDFAVVKSTATVETICGGCSSATPGIIGSGVASYVLTTPATVTLSGTSTVGTVYWYLDHNLQLTAAHNSAATLICSAQCLVVTGLSAFPPDSAPLWVTTFTGNIWDAIVEATMDVRPFLWHTIFAPGVGISMSSNPSTGVVTASMDPTIVPRYFAGSGAPSGNCTVGRDFYTDTAGLDVYFCDAANTWKQANGSGGGSQTIFRSFLLVTPNNGGPAYADASWSNGTAYFLTETGPNSISADIGALLLSATNSVMVSLQAPSTWSAAAGTVDVAVISGSIDGAPSAGNWVFNFYVGCNTNGAGFSFGTVSTVTAAPPAATGDYTRYAATGLGLPSSCAAGSEMQFWVQRGADTGGTTGVRVSLIDMEVVVRGN